eukprot:scaffold6168_cov420-Prasinococcus_capsulatus_cf.AAC.2
MPSMAGLTHARTTQSYHSIVLRSGNATRAVYYPAPWLAYPGRRQQKLRFEVGRLLAPGLPVDGRCSKA